MNDRRLILVTNDDSIHAKGLKSLVEILRPFGDIVVVAPMEPQSCMSHAVTLKNPLRVRKIKEETGITVYSCSGTPVDCVKVAMGKLVHRRPDLLVSGINHGANSSINVVYSGTMAAAAEGVFYGVPSIGFSLCDHSSDADFSGTIPHAGAIVQQVLDTNLPVGICLNVNFPVGVIKGIRLCRQNRGAWNEAVEQRNDPHGYEYFWLNGNYVNHEPESVDTDEAALANGYVSVVPVKYDFTDYAALTHMQTNWIKIYAE